MVFSRTSRLSLILMTAIGLTAFTSSRSAVDEVCQDWLPAFDRDFARHSENLAQGQFARSRAPASAVRGMDDGEKRRWTDWSEKMLAESHRALDLLEGQGSYLKAREEISQVATRWVEFRGYAEKGRIDRMQATLISIRLSATRARRLACH